jgi:hypothetical protein
MEVQEARVSMTVVTIMAAAVAEAAVAVIMMMTMMRIITVGVEEAVDRARDHQAVVHVEDSAL